MASRQEQYQKLVQQIRDWNASRLDLFEISLPNEALEFHGVMRFYYQDDASKVSTKCIRVSNTATTRDVLNTLIEKFRPDMKMLTLPTFGLYEVHSNGDERKLNYDELPLLVQLNWGKDDREGRFLLKRENAIVSGFPMDNTPETGEFKRKLSKREKKELKKKEKEIKTSGKENESPNKNVANDLYFAVPETSFTRSISNPEAVMRRRRQQKLEKKLHDLRNKADGGGTLKIYGETINADVPYKTLLLSVNDTAAFVVKETLDKYGLDREDPDNYCLTEVILPPGGLEYNGESGWQEHILDDDECPLAILLQQLPHQGTIMFHLKQRPPGMPRKRKKPASVVDIPIRHTPAAEQQVEQPYLEQLNPDGSVVTRARKHYLVPGVTEVGGQPSSPGRDLQLPSPDIYRLHCTLAYADGVVTVTPANPNAEVVVNNQRIYDTTIVYPGSVLFFGKSFIFRFANPSLEKVQRARPVSAVPTNKNWNSPDHSSRDANNFETTFDVDGHIETMPREDMQIMARPFQGDMLPASVEFYDSLEDNFLSYVIYDVMEDALNFKLTPSYTLYLIVRHRFVITVAAGDRGHMAASLACKIADMIIQIIGAKRNVASYLALWMANASELLHFMKRDRDLGALTSAAQDLLAEAVQDAFGHFVACMEAELEHSMRAFLDPSRDDLNDDGVMPMTPRGNHMPNIYNVLDVLSSTMAQLRRCRVNAALTIQLFSQLFHFINMWLFNKLVLEPQLRLCTRNWGHLFKRRIGRIEKWAEKQGLELAAECHLARIIQAAHLLEAPKGNADDITSISSTCFKLNSLQLRYLLENYQPSPGEQPIPRQLVDKVVDIARSTADDMTISEGRDICLEEERDLMLPFLLPEDGYSCDNIKGLPTGLTDYLQVAAQRGFCRFTVNQTASGAWTIHMKSISELELDDGDVPDAKPQIFNSQQPVPRNQPEVIVMTLQKKGNSLGLSIVAAKGEHTERGIYIKSVVPNGAAHWDQRLAAGDQLLEVDGKSLIGVSQEDAAKMMKMTGEVVTLKVAKEAAVYHGLAQLLMQPSPEMQRAPLGKQSSQIPANQQQPYGPGSQQLQQQPQQQIYDAQPTSSTTGGYRQPSSKSQQQSRNSVVPPQQQLSYGSAVNKSFDSTPQSYGQTTGGKGNQQPYVSGGPYSSQLPGSNQQQLNNQYTSGNQPQTYGTSNQKQPQPFGSNGPSAYGPNVPFSQQQPSSYGSNGPPYNQQNQQPGLPSYGTQSLRPQQYASSSQQPYGQYGPSNQQQQMGSQQFLGNQQQYGQQPYDQAAPVRQPNGTSGSQGPLDSAGHPLYAQIGQRRPASQGYSNENQFRPNGPPPGAKSQEQLINAAMYSDKRKPEPPGGAPLEKSKSVSNLGNKEPMDYYGYPQPAYSSKIQNNSVATEPQRYASQPDLYGGGQIQPKQNVATNQEVMNRPTGDQSATIAQARSYGDVNNIKKDEWNQPEVRPTKSAYNLREPSDAMGQMSNTRPRSEVELSGDVRAQAPYAKPAYQDRDYPQQPFNNQKAQSGMPSYSQQYPGIQGPSNERAYRDLPSQPPVRSMDNAPLPSPPSSALNWQTESPPPRPPPPAENYEYQQQQQPIIRQYSSQSNQPGNVPQSQPYQQGSVPQSQSYQPNWQPINSTAASYQIDSGLRPYQPSSGPQLTQPVSVVSQPYQPVAVRELPGRQLSQSEPQYPYQPRPAPASVDLNVPSSMPSRYSSQPVPEMKYSQPDPSYRQSVSSNQPIENKNKPPPPLVRPKPAPVSNAWERDQKERDEKVQEDEMRRAREDEIHWLESKSSRSPEEEEILKRLRIDAEFEKRAKEVDSNQRDFGTDIELQMERMKMVELMKNDIDRRQHQYSTSRYNDEQEQLRKEQEVVMRQEQKVQNFDQQVRERERVRHSQSFKQAQEDPVKETASSDVQMRRDVPVRRDVPPERSSVPRFDSSSQNRMQPPPPPERKSSYETYGLHQGVDNVESIPKRPVSYYGQADPILSQIQTSKGADDENKVVMTHGISTPGVVGLQEVYRDPRERLMQSKAIAQQVTQQQPQSGPEIMSFRDKMKLFAMDAGGVVNVAESEKARNSSAQRRIEQALNAQ